MNQGKPLAVRYHEAIMTMVPKTDWEVKEIEKDENGKETEVSKELAEERARERSRELYKQSRKPPHESINDLPVHVATGQQIFLPTSESRQFTRADAAKVFDEKLLPADDRVPHPELAIMHRETLQEVPKEERRARAEARDAIAEKKRAAALARQARKEAAIKRIDTGRWEYRFTEIKVDDAGKDGRGLNGVGWRYGAPHMDRSRAQHKIPTTVE